MNYLKIKKVTGQEIIDSGGNPTVEAEIVLADGTVGRGAAPSGASTGEFEALELRDHEDPHFGGEGVLKAVRNISIVISDALKEMNAADIYTVDRAMIRANGTKDKSGLGANTILTISIACVRVTANGLDPPLYHSLGGVNGNRLPVPMMSILDGSAHAASAVDVQELIIMPVGAESFKEGLRWCVEVFHALAALLKEKKLVASAGNESGLTSDLGSDEEAIQHILAAAIRARYEPETDSVLAMDAASSGWKSRTRGEYLLSKSGKRFTLKGLVDHWEKLIGKYPTCPIEDGLDEKDWGGWRVITDGLGNEVRPVSDDLFVTNTEHLAKGISQGYRNSILVKLNQIGTVSETLETIEMTHNAGYTAIASHRSGETEDTIITDLTVALNTYQIKMGALSRNERVAKYDQLLRTEEELGEGETYPGMNALRISG